MKLHILAIAAHPDDVELGCAGTLIRHARKGQATGILDLTEGELGTRGTPALRRAEAADAAAVMGAAVRENARMADGFFRNDEEHQRRLIRYIREYRPEIVLANALADRHPDHGRAGRLIADSCFLAGLRQVKTQDDDGQEQEAWRPKRVFHMIQDRVHTPDIIVDISEVFSTKMEAIRCYRSQFHDPGSAEPVTYISTPDFLRQIEYRDMLTGKQIGVDYAEGFVCENIPGVRDLDQLVYPALS